MLDRLLDALASLPLALTYLVLMALSALENVFPPVPAVTAVALGAFLARRGEVSVVPLVTLCWLANVGSVAGPTTSAAGAGARSSRRAGGGSCCRRRASLPSRRATRGGGWPASS